MHIIQIITSDNLIISNFALQQSMNSEAVDTSIVLAAVVVENSQFYVLENPRLFVLHREKLDSFAIVHISVVA